MFSRALKKSRFFHSTFIPGLLLYYIAIFKGDISPAMAIRHYWVNWWMKLNIVNFGLVLSALDISTNHVHIVYQYQPCPYSTKHIHLSFNSNSLKHVQTLHEYTSTTPSHQLPTIKSQKHIINHTAQTSQFVTKGKFNTKTLLAISSYEAGYVCFCFLNATFQANKHEQSYFAVFIPIIVDTVVQTAYHHTSLQRTMWPHSHWILITVVFTTCDAA